MPEFKARFVTDPIVAIVGEMQLVNSGLHTIAEWVRLRAPQCLPEDYDVFGSTALFPHDGTRDGGLGLSGNELLVELAGRKCYNSFGEKAGRKTNAEYIENLYSGDVPHRSVLYHAKISFFIAGVSRRVSHELIRNYVGADRSEEGSPSQESTRYVENAGFYVIPPRYLDDPDLRAGWEEAMHENYSRYRIALTREYDQCQKLKPTGMAYKRMLEAASSYLSHSVETSWIWTTNPEALAKLVREREAEAADLEFRRLAKMLRVTAVLRYPGLFPQPWMRPQEESLASRGNML